MRRLTHFVVGSVTYTLTYLQDWQDNFAEVVPRTVRTVGADGGFDSYGSDPSPAAIGNIQGNVVVTVNELTEMTAKVDALRRLSRLPKGTLFAQMEDGTVRYCKARINNIQTPQSEKNHTEVWLKAQISWQANNPHWLGVGSEYPLWGEFIWGQESELPPSEAVAGASTDFVLSLSGTVETLPRIVIECGTGETAENVTIQRLVDGSPVDEVSFADTLVDGDSVEIDCNTKAVTKNSVDAYDMFDYDGHPDWIRLQPGDNDIRVLMDNGGDAATVTLYYNEVYV